MEGACCRLCYSGQHHLNDGGLNKCLSLAHAVHFRQSFEVGVHSGLTAASRSVEKLHVASPWEETEELWFQISNKMVFVLTVLTNVQDLSTGKGLGSVEGRWPEVLWNLGR